MRKTALQKAKAQVASLTEENQKLLRKSYVFDTIVDSLRDTLKDEIRDEMREIAQEEVNEAFDNASINH